MKRRTLLVSLGGIVAGGAAIGTGAFTSVEADRTVNVAIADEDSGLLALKSGGGPNSEFARPQSSSREELRLDFDDPTDETSRGPGTDSKYKFDRVFKVQNQGTQTVYFESEFPDTEDIDSIEFYVEETDDHPVDGESAVAELGDGESANIGVMLDTDGIDVERGEGNTNINNFDAEITASDEPPEDVDIVDIDGNVENGNGSGAGGG